MPLFGPNIANLKQTRNVAGLVKALPNSTPRVRIEIIVALAEIGDKAAVPTLIELLAADNTLEGRSAAAQALGVLGDEAAIEPLLKENAASNVREREAIDAAMQSKERVYREGFYVNRIAAEEYSLRNAIAGALGKIGTPRAVQALFEMLAMESGRMEGSVKASVNAALGEALLKEGAAEPSTPVFLEKLHDPSVEIRHTAAHHLGSLGSPQTVDALLAAACDENEEYAVREAAIASLGYIGDTRVLDKLENLQHSPNRGIARDAHQSISLIRQRNT